MRIRVTSKKKKKIQRKPLDNVAFLENRFRQVPPVSFSPIYVCYKCDLSVVPTLRSTTCWRTVRMCCQPTECV